MKKYLHDLYKRKDLIFYLVISGLKAQHKNSFLGYFWWLLDPFLGVLVYFFVVVIVFQRGGPGYGIYLVVGMIVWRWLSSTVSSASRSIVSSAGIISQVYMPKAVFPIGVVLTHLINFAFGLLVIALFLGFFSVVIGTAIVWLPFIVAMQLLFMMALAFFTAYVCVFVRDIDNILNHLMRLWFFGSPVIWSEDMIPDRGKWLLQINPMTHFLANFRNVFIDNQNPDYLTLLFIGALSTILLGIMINYYNLYEHRIIKAL